MSSEIERIHHLERKLDEEYESLGASILEANMYGYMNKRSEEKSDYPWTNILIKIAHVRSTAKELEQSLRKEFSKT